MKTRTLYLLAIFIVMFIVIGQTLIYIANPYNTSSNSWSVEGGIEYEVSSNTSSNYDVFLIDIGISIPDGLMIYNDPRYVSYENESIMDERIDLLCSELSLRNVEYRIVDAEQVKIELEENLFNGFADARLIIPGGVLPDTIYSNEPDSLILKWLEIGGVLYWTGYTIGRGISSTEGIYERDGYATDFFNISDQDLRRNANNLYSTEKAINYEMGKKLSVIYNDSTFGINTRNLTNYISIGFTSQGYDSLILTKYHKGNGMIVIFGGKLANNTAPIIAQVIASKITYCSKIAEHNFGRLFHSTDRGYIEADPSKIYSLYIYVGTPQIYARAFDY